MDRKPTREFVASLRHGQEVTCIINARIIDDAKKLGLIDVSYYPIK